MSVVESQLDKGSFVVALTAVDCVVDGVFIIFSRLIRILMRMFIIDDAINKYQIVKNWN